VSDVNTPRVDFIIVSKNQLHFTRQCVESLFANVSIPSHLIWIDNASNDGTRTYLEQAKHNKPAHFEVTLIFSSENLGYGLGLNRGLIESKAPYVFFCNNDIKFFQDSVEEVIRIAESNPKFGLVNPNSNEFTLKSHDLEVLKGLKGSWIERTHTSGFCVLVKREVINLIGGIDPDFNPAYFEDMDYAERAKKAGFLCAVARGAYVQHYGTRTFLPKEKQTLWDKHKKIFTERWGGTKWFCVYGDDQDFKTTEAAEHFRGTVLELARRETAIIYLFIPNKTRHYLENMHDSFRIVESVKELRGLLILLKVWRSSKSKPITRIYAVQSGAKKTMDALKPFHGAEVCSFKKLSQVSA